MILYGPLILHCLSLSSMSSLPAPAQPQGAAQVELPEGAYARAWAAVDPENLRELPADFRGAVGHEAGPWSSAATWKTWASALEPFSHEAESTERRETESTARHAAARARLCLLALDQDRLADAWEHFRACGSTDPGWMAALMPELLPGVPAGSPPVLASGDARLPAGVLLRPTLPPPDPERAPVDAFAPPPERRASVSGLRIGKGVVDLSIGIDANGVQVDLIHVGGEPVELSVLLPEPTGLEVRVEYVDWSRQNTLREPLPVTLAAEQRVSLFARCLPSEHPWPALSGGALSENLRRGGLSFVIARDDPERAAIEAAAQAIADLTGLTTRVVDDVQPTRAAKPAVQGSPWGGTRISLPPGPERARKLAWLASSVEKHLLAREP